MTVRPNSTSTALAHSKEFTYSSKCRAHPDETPSGTYRIRNSERALSQATMVFRIGRRTLLEKCSDRDLTLMSGFDCCLSPPHRHP